MTEWWVRSEKERFSGIILSENHFRAQPTRAPAFRQDTTSMMETNTTRTICIPYQGKIIRDWCRQTLSHFCLQRRYGLVEALQPQPQHPGLQEQAGDESPGVAGARQVGREDYNNTTMYHLFILCKIFRNPEAEWLCWLGELWVCDRLPALQLQERALPRGLGPLQPPHQDSDGDPRPPLLIKHFYFDHKMCETDDIWLCANSNFK